MYRGWCLTFPFNCFLCFANAEVVRNGKLRSIVGRLRGKRLSDSGDDLKVRGSTHLRTGLFNSGVGQKFGFANYHTFERTLRMPFASYQKFVRIDAPFSKLHLKLLEQFEGSKISRTLSSPCSQKNELNNPACIFECLLVCLSRSKWGYNDL